MNFRNILHDIEKTDPEVYEKLSGRRQVLKSFGAKVAVAALPLAIASLLERTDSVQSAMLLVLAIIGVMSNVIPLLWKRQS